MAARWTVSMPPHLRSRLAGLRHAWRCLHKRHSGWTWFVPYYGSYSIRSPYLDIRPCVNLLLFCRCARLGDGDCRVCTAPIPLPLRVHAPSFRLYSSMSHSLLYPLSPSRRASRTRLFSHFVVPISTIVSLPSRFGALVTCDGSGSILPATDLCLPYAGSPAPLPARWFRLLTLRIPLLDCCCRTFR